MSEDRAYSWDQGPIDQPKEGGGEYSLLPPGKYPFRVLSWARGRHDPKPDSRIGACPKAIVKVEVDGGDLGSFTKDVNMFLHSRCEGILASFFACLGLRQHGEPLRMEWDRIVGRTGTCKTKHQKGTGDKADKTYNDIAEWCYPEASPAETEEIPF